MSPERFDAWRVMPRFLVLLYGVLVYRVCDWFMSIDAPSPEQSAFALSVTAAGAAWFKFYVHSGPAMSRKTDGE